MNNILVINKYLSSCFVYLKKPEVELRACNFVQSWAYLKTDSFFKSLTKT